MSTSETQRLQPVKRFFRWYYFNFSERISAPDEIEQREFGYMNFEGAMIRHLSFKSPGEYRAFLVRSSPLAAYYSVALYHDPTAPMESKGWIKADLAFDIDIKDASPKIKENSFWICRSCHSYGPLPKPERCPRCGSKNVDEVEWVCDECMREVKEAATALMLLLMEDFGISRKNIKIYFSGNNGYHFHVLDERMRKLGQPERIELVDYILMNGYDERILQRNSPEGAVIKQRRKIPIDPNVTVDVRRIFRAPESLHNESGLSKREVERLESFDPFTDAVVLPDEEVEINVYYMPRIKFKEQTYGPFKEERLKLPAFLAVYLHLKGLGEIIEQGR
ncbi:MAG: DNA primase small subunit domain-containing protein [Nitrososphaeria archaeon]